MGEREEDATTNRRPLTARQIDLLLQIRAGDVTFHQRLDGEISYRLWGSEYEYVLVTPKVKLLRERGLVTLWHNPSNFGRGGVEPTGEGRSVLTERTGTR